MKLEKTQNKQQNLIIDYLLNCNDVYLQVAIEKCKDKDFSGCYNYITGLARKEAVNNCAMIEDSQVYEWAKEYFIDYEAREQAKEEKKEKVKEVVKEKAKAQPKPKQMTLDEMLEENTKKAKTDPVEKQVVKTAEKTTKKTTSKPVTKITQKEKKADRIVGYIQTTIFDF